MKATVTLTDAQIKALPTTPVEIVSAPGIGKVNFIFSAFIRGNIGTAYTNIDASGSYIGIDYGFDIFEPTTLIVNHTTSSTADLGALLQGTNERFHMMPIRKPTSTLTWAAKPVDLGNDDTNSIDNLPLYIFCYNSGGDFTGGDVANTLKVTIFYSVIDV